MTDPVSTFAVLDRADTGSVSFRGAAVAAGLRVIGLPDDPAQAVGLVEPGTVLRTPGGYLAAVAQHGADVTVSSGTPEWFCSLDPEITGRTWRLVTPDEALALVERRPRLVKLADGKHPALPARRHDRVSLADALQRARSGASTQLLTTDVWLDIHSEYRVFTSAREALTCSPYLVEDDPYTPTLRWHHASFHDDALEFAAGVLRQLSDDEVPPASVLDVARLSDDRFVVLEVNNPWSAGLYGCDPAAALRSVVAASDVLATGPGDRWRWRPELTVSNPRWMGPAH